MCLSIQASPKDTLLEYRFRLDPVISPSVCYEDFQSFCRSETMCHYWVTTESIQALRGRRKLELRGRFLEVFRVIQVRQYS